MSTPVVEHEHEHERPGTDDAPCTAPILLLAGDDDEGVAETHIWRSID
ncbi:hypothetical protein QMK28_02355 [Streptomyces sp. H27-D2]|nr:hypothetical protein [Streptomyces sp. H27-D2]